LNAGAAGRVNNHGLPQIPGNLKRRSTLKLRGTDRRSTMTANRLELIGLSVLVLVATATVSPAQNTGNALLSGNTTNPVLSGNSTILPARSELSVSPSLPSTGLLTNATNGTNQLTGMQYSVVGERRGRPSRHNGTAFERGLGEPATADIPNRVRTGQHVGCVLTKVAAALW
jgi:hypothetical protein